MSRASVVLPVPGGPQRISECSWPRSSAWRSGLPGADHLLLPDELIERARPHAIRERPQRVVRRGVAQQVRLTDRTAARRSRHGRRCLTTRRPSSGQRASPSQRAGQTQRRRRRNSRARRAHRLRARRACSTARTRCRCRAAASRRRSSTSGAAPRGRRTRRPARSAPMKWLTLSLNSNALGHFVAGHQADDHQRGHDQHEAQDPPDALQGHGDWACR